MAALTLSHSCSHMFHPSSSYAKLSSSLAMDDNDDMTLHPLSATPSWDGESVDCAGNFENKFDQTVDFDQVDRPSWTMTLRLFLEFD